MDAKISKTAQRREQARAYAATKRANSPEYRQKHAQYMRDYDQRRSLVDPEYLPQKRAYSKAWYKVTKATRPTEYMWRAAKERARVKCQTFTISVIDIRIPNQCPCCGKELRFGPRPNPDAPSIDRLDSAQGYIPTNIQIICQHCNQVKNSGTAQHHEQIAAWMRSLGAT